MQIIHRIQSEEVLKLLGDPTRLEILRILIAKQATISQLGTFFHIHPARVRHHIKLLEKEGLVELVSVQTEKNYIEKYYRATAKMFLVNMAVLSEPTEKDQLVMLASDDPALNFLITRVNSALQRPFISTLPVGSLDALIYLKEKFSDIAGCHLFDAASGEYNVPYIHHLFSDQNMVVVHLVGREQGLYVKRGNPLQVKSMQDLTRSDVFFKNRKRGSGTRLWIDQSLKTQGIKTEEINSSLPDASTHAEVAEAVSYGLADTGIGVLSVARSFDLDFIPLFTEQYDLVMTGETFQSDRIKPILDALNDPNFREFVLKMGGYSVTNMGQFIKV